ncbi:alpha/beta hydrolase [Shimia sp.]|uniref:alpha/beta hydrolase n=1 Tax=Shimia sp. TaxID=1954381 RepID=UPI003BA99B4C
MKQRFAMWLIKRPAGLRFSLRGSKKAALRDLEGAVNERVAIPRRDGNGTIRTRIYKPANAKGPLPVVVYFHGGGFATGWPERHHAIYQRLMKTRPCIIVAPAFRSSLKAPYPAGHDDCYDALLWARDNAESIGGNSQSIIVAGNSSGGGIALSTALRARDTGEVNIAFQMPLYPMVDDRSKNWSALPKDKITWTKEHGVMAWHLLLRGLRAEKRYDIPAYAVPALATDLSKLSPMLSYVGADDILMNEVKDIAERVEAAGNDVTFRVFDGLFHAMEDNVPDAQPTIDVHNWVEREFGRMIDQHCGAT